MSMLTPLGRGVGQQRRRGGRRGLALVLVVTLVAATAAALWWLQLRDDGPAVSTGSGGRRPCPTPVAIAPAPPAPLPPTTAPSPTFLPGTPAPAAKVRIAVYNATRRAGLARKVGDELARRRFVVTGIGNDPKKRVVTAVAEIRFGPAGAAAALSVAAQLTDAVPVVDARRGADVELVLGAAYVALRTPAQAAAAATPVRPVAPTPTPAPVTTAPSPAATCG